MQERKQGDIIAANKQLSFFLSTDLKFLPICKTWIQPELTMATSENPNKMRSQWPFNLSLLWQRVQILTR
jgi:hypothetical protein